MTSAYLLPQVPIWRVPTRSLVLRVWNCYVQQKPLQIDYKNIYLVATNPSLPYIMNYVNRLLQGFQKYIESAASVSVIFYEGNVSLINKYIFVFFESGTDI